MWCVISLLCIHQSFVRKRKETLLHRQRFVYTLLMCQELITKLIAEKDRFSSMFHTLEKRFKDIAEYVNLVLAVLSNIVARMTDFRKLSFAARVVNNVWNSLPNYAVDVHSVTRFKSRLDKFWATFRK